MEFEIIWGFQRGGSEATMPSRRAHDLEDELLIGIHDKWSAHPIISNHKFTHEQSIDQSKKLRGESFRRMVQKEESIGPHLFSPIITRNRKGVAES